ncbi:MAG TPA: DUF1622 domain-containing protein [Thermoanaerobaculia bacterium]|nr:DUF1622 domain-containing protein [Thermoanaerobaculia bacterium]
MSARFHEIMGVIGLGLDAVGVLIVAIGAMVATIQALRPRQVQRYRILREDLGRAIVLSLEFLIAGDIIRSVVVDPTVVNVLVLGLIVVIRTFLSMTLQLEVEGRWPWQQTPQQQPRSSDSVARISVR